MEIQVLHGFRRHPAGVLLLAFVLLLLPWTLTQAGIDSAEPGVFSNTATTDVVRDTPWRVTEIYIATMGYAPDNEGLQYWIQKIDNEAWTPTTVAQSFFDQPLVQEQYPDTLGDDGLIEALYQNLFGRPADAAGKAYWLGELDSGRVQRNEMIVTLIEGGWANADAAADMARFGNRVQVGLAFADQQSQRGILYSALSNVDQVSLRRIGRDLLTNITSAPATRDRAIASISGKLDGLGDRNWATFRAGPQRLGFNPYENILSTSTVGALQVRWEFQTGGSVDASPVVVDGSVYIGSGSTVYAIDSATGVESWEFETDGSVSSPSVAHGILYIGSGSSVYAIDALTGVERWKFETGSWSWSSASNSSPAVVDGIVYVGAAGGVYALDAATGIQRWNVKTDYQENSSPAVVDGILYIGSIDGKIYAINAAAGVKLWQFQTGGPVYSSPAVANGVVYVGSNYDNVYALDAATGSKLWTFETDGDVSSSPAVVDGVVYVGSNDRNLYALDAATGTKRWAFKTAGYGYVDSSPAVANGILYVGGSGDRVYALNADTGVKLWEFETDGYVDSSPAVVDGVLYVGSDDHQVYAFDTRSAGGSLNATQSPILTHD